MKQLSTVLLAFCFAVNMNLFAQQPPVPNEIIKFEKTSHDFGDVKEDGGAAAYPFKFTNVSKYPVKLTGVRPGCGCTTPSWTKEVIKPGESGIATLSYDPMNRPGKASKGATVTAIIDSSALKSYAAKNAPPKVTPPPVDNTKDKNKKDKKDKKGDKAKTDDKKITSPLEDTAVALLDSLPAQQTGYLSFSINVLPRTKGPADFYPQKLGNLRFSTNYLYYNNVKNNELKDMKVVIYNEGTEPITVKELTGCPKYLTYTFSAKTVQPKDTIVLKAILDVKKVNDYDWFHETLKLQTDDKLDSAKIFYVGGTVEEYFAPMNKMDSLLVPKAVFDKVTHDFGVIKPGDNVKTAFTLTNTGKKDLIIRKVKSDCGCTAGQPDKMQLKAGESTKVNVTFNSTGKANATSNNVTIIVNDPMNPKHVLNIKGNVTTTSPPSPTPTPTPAPVVPGGNK